jgi:phospholipid transport system transporter-binding protein
MKLPATVTLAQASAVLREIESEAPGPDGSVLIDAGALQNCDSSALAVLLEARRIAIARGGTLQLTGAPAKLAALAALYGVDGLLAVSSAPPPRSGST